MKDQIMVSVQVIAYNHRDFIKDTIESILNQRTQFRFEIIIHDDASTDGTREIIEEYASKYPNIIIPILEEENQYSKGIGFGLLFFPYIRGRFLANCDGDDQWIDCFKLQKQVDFMIEHPDVIACCTNGLVNDYYNNKEYNYCIWKRNHYVTFNDLYYKQLGIMKPSAWMVRAFDYMSDKDIITKLGGCADAPLQLWMLTKGKVYYMSDVSIIYRLYSPNSWSTRYLNGEYKDESNKGEEGVDVFNEITNYRYDKIIRKKRNIEEYRRVNNYYKDIDLLSCIGIRRMIKTGCYDLAAALVLYKLSPNMYQMIRSYWRKIINED